MSEPAGPDPGICIGCARPSASWACPACRSSLDHVVSMLHAPRGEVIATWLSIMTTDARLARDRDAGPAPAGLAAPARLSAGTSRPPEPVPQPDAAPSAEPATPAATPDGCTDRLVALGLIVERSAAMEQQIREAFGVLAGGGYAAAVAAGQPAGWLIGRCEALADARQDLPESGRQAIRDALASCRAAGTRRAQLEHSLQAGDVRGDCRPAGQSPATSDIRVAGEQMRQAGLRLTSAVRQALRPDSQPSVSS